jgi:hypothetical protein
MPYSPRQWQNFTEKNRKKRPLESKLFSRMSSITSMLIPAIFYHLFTIFRLHEFDDQVKWVREGMAKVVPVPLLSLFTGLELETMVR